jgi:hypothetical protein
LSARRQRRIIIPSPRTLERLCVTVRYRARRELERRLIGGSEQCGGSMP